MRTAAQVAEAVKSKSYQVLDARPPGRFLGNEPEPRKGLRSGHIPGSKNVFFKTLLQPDNTMKSPGELAQVLLAAGVDMTQPIITSCGSGVTAAILNLALTQLEHSNHSLYDGSWAQWGMSEALPIETGST
jgi:thiosulfate/3-mercaptopyruvate sulfurtransferase